MTPITRALRYKLLFKGESMLTTAMVKGLRNWQAERRTRRHRPARPHSQSGRSRRTGCRTYCGGMRREAVFRPRGFEKRVRDDSVSFWREREEEETNVDGSVVDHGVQCKGLVRPRRERDHVVVYMVVVVRVPRRDGCVPTRWPRNGPDEHVERGRVTNNQ